MAWNFVYVFFFRLLLLLFSCRYLSLVCALVLPSRVLELSKVVAVKFFVFVVVVVAVLVDSFQFSPVRWIYVWKIIRSGILISCVFSIFVAAFCYQFPRLGEFTCNSHGIINRTECLLLLLMFAVCMYSALYSSRAMKYQTWLFADASQ